MIENGKLNLLGIQIAATNYASSVDQIVNAARLAKPFGVSALAVHGVMSGVMDPEHKFRLNALELVVPDGQPVRWGLNLLHPAGLTERVYGPKLMLEVCRAASESGLRICLFGSTQELLDQLKKQLVNKYPNLQIVKSIPSKFRKLGADEKKPLVEEIKTSGAQITFCGLGCPRQETWAFEFKDELSMPVIAVGAAFDFHAGRLAQAPSWMQNLGLEWAFRLSQEPKRLWRRYLLLNPYYLLLLTCQFLHLKRFDPKDCRQPNHETLFG